jgi:23S rRNA (pseudouridine1915-N3)-methyltransferase
MGREFLILSAGRRHRGPWETICDDFRARIGKFAKVEDRRLKARTSGEAADRRRHEGKLLLEASPDPCWGIALDSDGPRYTSEAWSRHLVRLKRRWPHPVVFYLGSDVGLDPAVLEAGREVLSFGPMTLSHDLARAVLYEQLYRALSIEAGINYHRGRI